MTVLEAAKRYFNRGWFTIPVPFRSKKPVIKKWQTLRIQAADIPAHFATEPVNIGMLLGEPSGWIIDVDLDHPRCVELADKYLPPTSATFGRSGKPRSHRLYRVTSPILRELFMSPNERWGMKKAILSVLAGDLFGNTDIKPGLRKFRFFYYLFSVVHLRRALTGWRRRAFNIDEDSAMRLSRG